jgi:hypothetical protein
MLGIITFSLSVIGRNKLSLLNQCFLFLTVWIQYCMSKNSFVFSSFTFFGWVNETLFILLLLIQSIVFTVVILELIEWIKKETAS